VRYELLPQAASLVSQKFVEKLRKVGRTPRLLGAVTAADALVGLRFECVGKAGPRGRSDRGFGADEVIPGNTLGYNRYVYPRT